MLYGVPPGDPVTFVLAALVLIAVAAVASALPGMRAATWIRSRYSGTKPPASPY